jgi:hypothetical protein
MGQDLRLGGFWNHSLGPQHQRPRLEGSVEADVCVVGAGYAGLWTAWALLRQQPALNVVIVEADYTGAGASGRNGGWLSGLLPGNRHLLARHPSGRAGVVALQRRLIDAVYGVAKACADEGIDADVTSGARRRWRGTPHNSSAWRKTGPGASPKTTCTSSRPRRPRPGCR